MTWLVVRGKGSVERSVPVSLKALETLHKYLEYLDIKHNGKYTKLFSKSYKTVWRRLKIIGEKAGISIRPHILRHTSATEMLSKGVDISTIAELLGHKSLNTTKRYAKIKDIQKVKAINVLN